MITTENFHKYNLTKEPILASIAKIDEKIEETASTTINLIHVELDNLQFEEWLNHNFPNGIEEKHLEDIIHSKTVYGQEFFIEESLIPDVQ